MPGSKNAAWDTRAQSADMNRVVLAARIGIFAALLGRLEEIGAEQVRPCISRLARR